MPQGGSQHARQQKVSAPARPRTSPARPRWAGQPGGAPPPRRGPQAAQAADPAQPHHLCGGLPCGAGAAHFWHRQGGGSYQRRARRAGRFGGQRSFRRILIQRPERRRRRYNRRRGRFRPGRERPAPGRPRRLADDPGQQQHPPAGRLHGRDQGGRNRQQQGAADRGGRRLPADEGGCRGRGGRAAALQRLPLGGVSDRPF